jgi:hypothetical protein
MSPLAHLCTTTQREETGDKKTKKQVKQGVKTES